MKKMKFADPKNIVLKTKETWKVLIVDDDESVHSVTKMVLSDFEYDGKSIHFLSAYNEKDALQILQDHHDIAVIFLDVVMEADDTGLKIIKKIREELHNHFIRIILRTGEPGSAPELDVIAKYNINDYKEKTELTATKLYSTTMTALRSYHDLLKIQKHQNSLDRVISSTRSITQKKSLEGFTRSILGNLDSILNSNMPSNKISGILLCKHIDNEYEIVSTVGEYDYLKTFEFLDENIQNTVISAFREKQTKLMQDTYCGYFRFNDKISYIAYVKDFENANEKIVEMFSSNISITFEKLALTQDILDTQEELIERLSEVIELRYSEGEGHIHRVATLSYMLALDYGFSEAQARLLRRTAPMHDVGKIGIPDHILLKPGPLTEEEMVIMETHTTMGYNLFHSSNRTLLKVASIIANQHHEKYDGTGYPHNLKGKNIHIFARIVSVADVLDALSHARCYKKPWPLETIIELLKREKGKHFDPVLVDIILNNIDKYAKIFLEM